jgi:hypothetical protein
VQVREEELQRHVPIQFRIVRPVNDTHRSLAEDRSEHIASDAGWKIGCASVAARRLGDEAAAQLALVDVFANRGFDLGIESAKNERKRPFLGQAPAMMRGLGFRRHALRVWYT